MNEQQKIEIIQKIPFFSSMLEEDQLHMLSLGDFQKFPPGQGIITQGTLNLTLFFLIAGQVEVYIDEKFITSFHGGGVPFGEMGIVNHAMASATVKAKTEAVLFSLSVDKINALIEPQYYRLRMEFYRACAEILAKKLINTNEMAKSYR